MKLLLPLLLAVAALAVSCSSGDDGQGYDRAAFGGWQDEDGDCRNTRHEVLAALSTAASLATTADGCRVLRGRWYDPYTGRIETDAGQLDIDHLVPLAWAWAHGASDWSRERRVRFANDLRNLVPTAAGVNRSKGADGPDEWLPPYKEGQCQYVLRFLRVAKVYRLDLKGGEARAIVEVQDRVCS